MPSDQEIIDAVLAGDADQFDELVSRYQRRLLGLLWHACGDRELAEDIGQEAFFRAYRKLGLFAGQCQFFTWLSRIGLNLMFSYRRHRRVESQLGRVGYDAVIDRLGTDGASSEAIELSETQTVVRQALELLDEQRRVILLLRDFEDMDYDTISQILKIPIGTVRSRLHRARMELKQILQQRSAQLGISEDP
ncbi:MAG: sigma-70 family RNA polymerase sigma factor [Pirellulaceae bacterium]|nr:sigma-70 family RNA polymerase sigma factor [Pirellulaceae bacterium]